MAISFTRPDPSSPSSVASASFPTSRKGFEQGDVREFLRMVAAELARLQERERFLERELRTSQRSTSPSSIALDEELVTKMLGEEAARILQTAREAGTQIKIRSEEGASRLLREATDEAQRLREEAEIESARRRQDATSDAESELEMAKQQGREMVNEARAYRERVLNELARRRELARQQIEQLIHGRDRLLQAFERSRLVAVDVMADLTPLGEPSEYVDLSPTTGPVPLMVPNMPRPGTVAPHDQDDQDDDDDPTTILTLVEPLVVEPLVIVETTTYIEPVQAPEVEVDAAPDAETQADLDVAEEVAEDDDAPEPQRVVKLDITHSDHSGDIDDPDREPATVVALFDVDREEVERDEADRDDVQDSEPQSPGHLVDSLVEGPDDTVALRTSADDLFARLRAARAQSVAERAMDVPTPPDAQVEPLAESLAEVEPTVTDTPSEVEAAEVEAVEVEAVDVDATTALTLPSEDSVFLATADAPTVEVVVDDTPFARRDEALTPLIVSAARKLKRVLADEQNDVLHALRGKETVRSIEMLVASEPEQVDRYVTAISGELFEAAAAGAVSVGARPSAAQRDIKKAHATAGAAQLLATDLIEPLRARLARCIADAEGDNGEMATLVRMVYREWKSQRIDEHLDDIARTAFGRGALVGVAPGTPICWIVDPNGPQCPDAEDNALAGVVPAGQPFPTDHACAPAHSGCRCMIVPAGD